MHASKYRKMLEFDNDDSTHTVNSMIFHLTLFYQQIIITQISRVLTVDFKDFLNKFNSSDELRQTAIQLNIENLLPMQNKIQNLILQETFNQPLDNQDITEMESMQENSGAGSSTWKNETQVSNYQLFSVFFYIFYLMTIAE